MAEIIQIREFQIARDRAQRLRTDHTSLVQAIELFRENLAAVADLMRTASEDQQPELLDRLEKLTVMLRYAVRARDSRDAPLSGNP